MKIDASNIQQIASVENSTRRPAQISNQEGAPVVAPQSPAPVQQSKDSEPVPMEESYVEFSKKMKQDLSVDEKDWIKLIERANKALNGANKSFEYSIHEATKQIMVKVIDKDTKEVIREIPSEKILDMVAKMWEMSGLFVDERR